MRYGKTERIDLNNMIREHVIRNSQNSAFIETYKKGVASEHAGLKAVFYDPFVSTLMQRGNLNTIMPYYRSIPYRTLRRVSEKAWVLNLCISNIIKKVRPFLKPLSEGNTRGFVIKKKITTDANKNNRVSAKEKERIQELEAFLLNTGDIDDAGRTDDLDKYVSKILRDLCQLDQIATEIQRTKNGKMCAFWAVDPATIEIVISQDAIESGIKYIQVVDNIPYAFYKENDFIFDCMNPRTDIERSGYGYSIVEQAIDLITSSINTFVYNAGFFTENKVPRGFLLLNGDADSDEVEMMEDYLANMMSGSPSSQWIVPIIPSGKNEGGEGSRRIEWINLQGTNREMEFQAWFDLQLSGIVGLFGLSMEDLGLHSQKSAPLIGADLSPKIETSKSLVLGDMLSFLQKHFNKILGYKDDNYVLEFVGYERDDPKVILDMDKEEVASFKTLNEKREERGYKKLDFTKIKNPADLPMNPQVLQAWQGLQQGDEDNEMGGEDGMDDVEMQEGGEDDDSMEVDKDVKASLTDSEEDVSNKEDTKASEKDNKKNISWDMMSKSLNIIV